MSAEKVCTLSIDHAIRIAKIIATAPVEQLPMITQLFQQASADLEGLESGLEAELEEELGYSKYDLQSGH